MLEGVNLFVGVHQEDERIVGVKERRPFIDIGIAIIKVDDGKFTLQGY